MKYFYLLSIITLIILTGCSDTLKSEFHEVDAIYWHENNRYSAKVIEEDGSVSSYIIPPHGYSTVKVYVDIPADLKPWYNCTWDYNGFSGVSNSKCEIHIRNLDELGTADWNHGKFGSGSTTRIQ